MSWPNKVLWKTRQDYFFNYFVPFFSRYLFGEFRLEALLGERGRLVFFLRLSWICLFIWGIAVAPNLVSMTRFMLPLTCKHWSIKNSPVEIFNSVYTFLSSKKPVQSNHAIDQRWAQHRVAASLLSTISSFVNRKKMRLPIFACVFGVLGYWSKCFVLPLFLSNNWRRKQQSQ